MANARELVLPLRGALVPVPAQPQLGVCSICHSSATAEFPICYQCDSAARVDPPEILPITLSVHGELIHDHLRNYKDSRSTSVRDRTTLRLAGLLAIFMANHARCVGEFDYATCVPSERQVALEPVVRRTRCFAGRCRQVLAARPGSGERELDPARFVVTDGVAGDRVLLLDDTFVTGASLFSAVAALRERRAVVVGPVVIGRHVHRDWAPSDALLSWIEKRPWDERRCARCDGERRSGTLV